MICLSVHILQYLSVHSRIQNLKWLRKSAILSLQKEQHFGPAVHVVQIVHLTAYFATHANNGIIPNVSSYLQKK
jgi:hypothetical protein